MDPPQKKKSKATLEDHWGKAKPEWERAMHAGDEKMEEETSNDDGGKSNIGIDATGDDNDDKEPHASESRDASGNCASLLRCIEKWNLIGPYSEPASEKKWANYYAERSALQFRHDVFFLDGDNKGGKDLAHFPRCYRGSWGDCRGAAVVSESEESPQLCQNCKKHVSDGGEYIVKYTEDINERWSTLVKEDASLHNVYCKKNDGTKASQFTDKRPPFMRSHCTESYATDCHESGTPRGEYMALRTHIQDRIKETIKTTTLCKDQKERDALGESMASGLYILDYFANFEECDVNADVRTVDFMTRLYPPNGSGKSIDLYWYRHFRARNTIANEKYSTLHVYVRNLEECDPFKPTNSVLSDRDGRGRAQVLAILDGDTDEDHVSKEFALLDKLRSLRSVVFGAGEEANKVSPRKVFALLARASGAHAVKKEGGWVFAGMRKRYELYPGEESDGEENGAEDGPEGCVIM